MNTRHALLLLLSVMMTGCLFLDDTPTVTCDALPACPTNHVEVSSCAVGSVCVTQELCGVQILCEEIEDQCLAYPTCAPGSYEVGACGDSETCEPVELCGQVIFCEREVTCDALPVCGPHELQVEACDDSDPNCRSVEACGAVIHCTELPVCEEPAPSCGVDELWTGLHCPDNVERCSEVRSSCDPGVLYGYCIPTPPPEPCLALPTCKPGFEETFECSGQDICHAESVCGETILCERDSTRCEEALQCPDGHQAVRACEPGRPCFEIEACGEVVACEAEVSDCQALPACPPEAEEVAKCDPMGGRCDRVTVCGHSILCQMPVP